jgi:hypothetical protein
MKHLAASFCLSVIAITTHADQPALTIYNQNFAVVRDTLRLDLKSGVTTVRFAGVTAQVDPNSVILRDPSGRYQLQILEQNYRNDPISQDLLLSFFEGKTIEFENVRTKGNTETREITTAKIVRSGYVPGGRAEQPIVEVNGKLRFSLPGQPLFPSLGDDMVLKPTLHWQLQSDQAGQLDAEVSYLTGGFNWEADYNLIAPEKGDLVDLVGWITMENQSGKSFEDARIKLMAGDVQKIQRIPLGRRGSLGSGGGGGAPAVTERAFDEYHLYTLQRSTTLHDRETKQVEFVRGANVKAAMIYVYDGALPDVRFGGGLNDDRNYGATGQKKVRVFREFANAETNHLGLPLPKGKMRFYRRSEDAQVEFIGEDTIEHTSRNETVRVTTGSSFDLVGERIQTDFKLYFFPPQEAIDAATGLPVAAPDSTTTNSPPSASQPVPWIDESFEIKLRNHKTEPVEIRVVEHLYRWSNWEIKRKSQSFQKIDSQTIEFRVQVKPEEEKVLGYTVRYTW